MSNPATTCMKCGDESALILFSGYCGKCWGEERSLIGRAANDVEDDIEPVSPTQPAP